MLKSYFITTWRSLVKNKVNSFINITGLAIGMACTLLITLYIANELSYDRFYPQKDQIYRINTDFKFGGADMQMARTADVMGPTLKKDYPQIETYTRIYADGSTLIQKGTQYFNETKVASVDSTFFEVFQLPVVEGDVRHALEKPGSVVLTASAAKRYFGTVSAMGKTLMVKSGDSLKPFGVKAVIKDFPANSHFNFDFLFDMQDVSYGWGAYTSHNFYTYVKLKKGVDYHSLEKHFPDYVKKYVVPYASRFIDISSVEEFEKAGNFLTYSMIPLTDIHLYSHLQGELSASGNIQYVYIFGAVALFILLMACINFINLTTAQAGTRAKEVGVRKVFGTDRKQLIFQFLMESMLMVLVAMIAALIIDAIIIPGFNQLSGKELSFTTFFSPWFLGIIILMPVFVGLLAGSYPAFFLSGFRPVQVLKGKLQRGAGSGRFRNALVVFQFAISIILIISTIVVYRQLHYMQNRNIGFVKDQVLIINQTGALGNHATAFKEAVLKMPGIRQGTFSGYLPVSGAFRRDNTYSTEPVMTSNNGFSMQNWSVDEDYIATLGMKLLQGRNFSRDFGSDSTAVVINEAAARYMGQGNPIGKYLYGSDSKGNVQAYHIIGVLKDFNYESMHSGIGPLGLFLGASPYTASFKISTADITGLIQQIKGVWDKFAPGMPFNYQFLDDSFNHMYQAEARTGTTAIIFSTLAIFISCLGLFGLAMFAVERRTKEIGIRKVLGASNAGIVGLLSKEFIGLVLLAFVMAAPVSWFCMHHWLQEFAYRTNIAWWIFVLAGSLALLIALVTVTFQSVKAALGNPVTILKAE